MTSVRKLVICSLAVVSMMACGAAAAECPPAVDIAKNVQKIFRKKVQIKEISPSAVDGLCEIVVTLQGKHNIIYTDSTGKYLLTGSLIDSETRKDLSREKLTELNRFSPEEMKELASLTALTLGESGPEVYFVTDPM